MSKMKVISVESAKVQGDTYETIMAVARWNSLQMSHAQGTGDTKAAVRFEFQYRELVKVARALNYDPHFK